jgi:hypothetical protein
MNLKTLATATKTNIAEVWRGLFPAAAQGTRERGGRVATDIALQRAMKNAMFVDYERRALVALMREMDQRDGRVKMIHSRVSRDVVRGGLVMQYGEKASSQTLKDEWERFEHRLQLNRQRETAQRCARPGGGRQPAAAAGAGRRARRGGRRAHAQRHHPARSWPTTAASKTRPAPLSSAT